MARGAAVAGAHAVSHHDYSRLGAAGSEVHGAGARADRAACRRRDEMVARAGASEARAGGGNAQANPAARGEVGMWLGGGVVEWSRTKHHHSTTRLLYHSPPTR